jgi:hypothetical protein
MTALQNELFTGWSALKNTRLFGRACNLTIGCPTDPTLLVKAGFHDVTDGTDAGKDISGLDFQFTVNKSLKPTEPNTLDLKVFNLSPDTRKQFSGGKPLTIRLEAGYVGGQSQLYFGEVRSGWTTREGADYITHFESSDTIARPTGVRNTKKLLPGNQDGNLKRTLGPTVPLDQAFAAIASQMKIGVGNLKTALAGVGAPISQISGAALLGPARQRMTDLCRSAGLEWSIQDGVLQLLNVGQALGQGTPGAATNAIKISAETGMLDSPSVDSQGAVAVSTLLIPGLAPGVLIVMDSLFTSGGYRVEKCRYVGDTRGNDWTCHLDAFRY